MEGFKNRAVALIVCAALALVGWFGGMTLQKQNNALVTLKASGLRGNAVVMEVAEQKITAENYLYWLTTTCDALHQQLGIQDWSMQITEDLTVGQYAKKEADYYVLQYAAITALAKENQITLTAEEEELVSGTVDSYLAYVGDEQLGRFVMKQGGLSDAQLTENARTSYLYKRLCESLLREGGELEPTEANLAAFKERHKDQSLEEDEFLAYYKSTEYGAVYDYVNDYIDQMEPEYTKNYDKIQVETYYPAVNAERQKMIETEGKNLIDE